MPVGSAEVFISAWPAAGPEISISVLAVMRRLSGLSATIDHLPSFSMTSTIEWPIAAMPRSTCSLVIALPASSSVVAGNMTFGEIYSLLTQSRPWSELVEPLGSGMKAM